MYKYVIYLLSLLLINTSGCSSVPSIDFHGRVIDQNNRSVKNAFVYYIGTSGFLLSGAGRGRVTTDDQGYFEIDSSGISLNLRGVTEPTIDRINYPIPFKTWNSTASNMPGSVRFLSYDDKQGRYPNWRRHTEKDNAFIVHAWRLNAYEGAIRGTINGFYDRDGKDYTLSFNQHTYKTKKNKGLTDGFLRVSCRRSSMESNRDYGDWSISLSPVNGGIQEVDGLYSNEAPINGYQASLDIVMRKSSSSYSHFLYNKRYYFMSNNGKQYGSLFMRIKPFASVEREACGVFIDYKINPTGSRNLELKKH